MNYHCTNCTRTFDGFADANNHEKRTEYTHLCVPAHGFGESLTRVEELVICSLRGCLKVIATAEAVWDDLDDEPYCSLAHEAEGRLKRSIGFYEDDLS